MLQPDPEILALRYEGSQDVDLLYSDGRQEHVQLKSGLEQSVTIAGLGPIFSGFALDLMDARTDDPERSERLRFRLVLRATSEDSAIRRIRSAAARPSDLAAMAKAIKPALAARSGNPKPDEVAADILGRLTIERGVGALDRDIWSFELTAERTLRQIGVTPLRVAEAVRALEGSLKPGRCLFRPDVQRLVEPYLSPSPAAPQTAPMLPWAYQERPDLIRALRDGIMASEPGRPVALHGMGGCGKTTLGLAMAADEGVRAAFPDGVLWATLAWISTDRN